jgi:hypothetical protein
MNAADTSRIISGIPPDMINSESIRLYPNPVGDVINLELLADAPDYCQLYNANGQMIRMLKVYNAINTFTVKDLKSGLYVLRISTPSGVVIQKFLKE